MRVAPLRLEMRSLLAEARRKPMTTESRERQIVSLAFGNANIENERVTKTVVAEKARAKSK